MTISNLKEHVSSAYSVSEVPVYELFDSEVAKNCHNEVKIR
jgi:hypothetical protein